MKMASRATVQAYSSAAFAQVAEADGNRTRQRRSAALTGFEDRGAHQVPRRLRVDSTAGGPGLRRQAVPVPWEQRDLPDVLGLGQPPGPALEADREPAVRRHAVRKGLQVVRVGGGVVAPRA